MFDNLRDFSDTPLYEDEPNDLYQDPEPAVAASIATPGRRRKKSGTFLGMTAQQRFLIAIMFLFAVCLTGTLAMFLLGKMSIF
jgi:hypothetical protein